MCGLLFYHVHLLLLLPLTMHMTPLAIAALIAIALLRPWHRLMLTLLLKQY
jgi:hypothetical protein